jgi:hypothetical protein
MARKAITASKNYNRFRMYLQRTSKIEIPGILSRFLLKKAITVSQPTTFFPIFVKELQEADIVVKKGETPKNGQYATLKEFRKDMIDKFILICQATKTDKDQKNPNFKAAKYKFHDMIRPYIDQALYEKIHDKMDTKASNKRVNKLENDINESLESLENKMDLRLQNVATQEQIKDLEIRLEDMEEVMINLLLEAIPPFTEIKAQIVRDYKHDKRECIRRLREISENSWN